uniref:Uncharacterized protein n=1 Tax=Arion vulgaris TaxID=1028688 RepID=A0A0B7B929_9EUPU
MSRKRVTNAWESDEELLDETKDTTAVTLHKTETVLSGDGRMLDEDVLLAVDEAGIATFPLFANRSVLSGTIGMTASNDGDMGELGDQAEQTNGDGAEFEYVAGEGDAFGDVQEDVANSELEQEQQMDQDEQTHKLENCEDDNDIGSDKLKNERTGVISLTPTTRRDSIPEKLEINEAQAAQLKQFKPDKSYRGRGKTRGNGRPNTHSLLGVRPAMGGQQNPQALLGQFLRGVLGQQPRMGFPFPGGPPNRGPFSAGIVNTQGPFPMRPLNQRAPFPGPHNQRGSFTSGPQRGPIPRLPQGRFLGTPNQRGIFLGGPQPVGPHRMPTGPQPIHGLPPNQLRFQGTPNQRVPNPNQFRQQVPLIGQQGFRVPLSGHGVLGPRPLLGNVGPRPLIGNVGPRPFMGTRPVIGSAGTRPIIGSAGKRPVIGSAGPAGMRFRATHPPQQNQSIPSLVNQVANALKSSLAFQPPRPGQPNSFMMPNPNNRPPGPMHGMNRFQHPTGQPQGPPRFMGRVPVPGGPFGNAPMFRGSRQPLLGGMGYQMAGKQKFFMNPRFPGQQTAFGAAGMGRTFRMGIPVQQRKAKFLLERAKQTQNKQVTPAKLTGIKRKSTGGEDVPSKVGKPDENVPEIA